jgi:V-type H+-transporting ATPase subunit D
VKNRFQTLPFKRNLQRYNVAGVKLPKFEHYLEGVESKADMTGLGKGGKQLQNCKKAYLAGRRVQAESTLPTA